MDHWVSVLSCPTLVGPGKDCLILIRDCGFFFGFRLLDFLSLSSFAGGYGRGWDMEKEWLIPLGMVPSPQALHISEHLMYSSWTGPQWQAKEVTPCNFCLVNKEFIGVTQRSMGNSQASSHC